MHHHLQEGVLEQNGLQPALRALAKRIQRPFGTVRRSVHVFPEDEVTTVSDRELEPEAGGLDADIVETIWQSVVNLYKTGTQPAIALNVRRHGEIIIDRAIGHARGNSPGSPKEAPKTLATPDTLYNFFSGSKPITAMLVHQLDEEGLLHIDDAVVEYIPEFGQNGKHDITIRHLLSHRAGIPTTQGIMDVSYLQHPEEIRRLYCEAHAESEPGHKLAYHAITGGFILGDIIEEVTGKSIQDYLKETIRDPLGLENLAYGVDESRLDEVARDACTGFTQIPPTSWIFERGFGASFEEVCEMGRDPRYLTGVVPSGNVIAKPHEFSTFFELLLREGELNGTQVFEPRTVRRAIKRTSYGELDGIIMLPLRYGMGFMLGGKMLSFYGYDSEKAFGHLGFTSILGYADPERDISVALLTTGKPLITPESLFWLNIPYTIARQVPKLSD